MERFLGKNAQIARAHRDRAAVEGDIPEAVRHARRADYFDMLRVYAQSLKQELGLQAQDVPLYFEGRASVSIKTLQYTPEEEEIDKVYKSIHSGVILRQVREKVGLKQNQMGELSSVSNSLISLMESGKRRVTSTVADLMISTIRKRLEEGNIDGAENLRLMLSYVEKRVHANVRAYTEDGEEASSEESDGEE